MFLTTHILPPSADSLRFSGFGSNWQNATDRLIEKTLQQFNFSPYAIQGNNHSGQMFRLKLAADNWSMHLYDGNPSHYGQEQPLPELALPGKAGIYIILRREANPDDSPPQKILYIGKTEHFKTRGFNSRDALRAVLSLPTQPGGTTKKFAELYVYFQPVNTQGLGFNLSQLESYLIRKYNPLLNQAIKPKAQRIPIPRVLAQLANCSSSEIDSLP